MSSIWHRLFLEERPSIGLSFFRIAVALTTGFHVIPSFIPIGDNYFSTAFKTLNYTFFTPQVLDWVQKSPDGVVLFFVFFFCFFWFLFLIGLFTHISCILMTLGCYYFYALNSFHIGTLSWDILLVTLFLMCLTPYPGDYFSVDCLRKGDPGAYKTKRPFFLQRLLQLQIACTFFYTALYKVTAQGNWIKDNPMYYLMNYPPEGVTKLVLYKEFLAGQPQLCYALGIFIFTMEFALPFLLFIPRTRVPAIILGFIFHIFLILTFDVPAIFFFLYPPQMLLFIHPDHLVRWVENKRQFHQKGRQAMLLYDGKCQFCLASVRQLAVMDMFGYLRMTDFHEVPDFKSLHPDLNKELAAGQIHCIEPDGVMYGGFSAFRRLCFNLPMLYPMLMVVYFPGMGILGPVLYRWVAKNRYVFHFNKVCRTNACFR